MNDPLEPDEEYARRALAAMTVEERNAYKGMSDKELLAMLRGDYWAEVDADAGHVDELDIAEAQKDSARARDSGELQ